ncbi:MAG: YheU family protein [Deltaproteobacteria bacterium]|nr:YheU family protein [Deltaproteobacteria bacterium]
MAPRVEHLLVEELPSSLVIPMDELEAETLASLVEAFVNREGTDYGAVERSLDDKVEDVLRQLRREEAFVVFDPETENINIVPGREMPGQS